MNRFLGILPAAALLFGLVGPVSMATASAQAPAAPAPSQTSGTVNGAIHDAGGAPVANANVKIVGAQTQSATTDEQGNFTFSNVAPGIYAFTASKPGYNTATETNITVLGGQTQTLAVTMNAVTFSSLRTIATVRSTSRGTFNTTPASVSVVTSQTFQDQAQAQVMKVLNETPGIVASLPQTSANGASPGAITFPNIRGALSFETASLIDGHPVSVGSFGDYVTTFLNPFILQNVEIIKGPGADAPEVNYAIGGTVNFRTKDPTYQPSGLIQFGTDTYGSSIVNFGFSDTAGRLGYVFAYGNNVLQSNVYNASVFVSPQSPQQGILNFNNAAGTGTTIGFNDGFPTPYVPNTVSTNTNLYNLVACCQTMQRNLYENQSELAKLRYKVSPVSTLTFTYLGSQTYTNQSANTGDISHSTFSLTDSGASPGQIASYTGSIANNSPLDVGFVRTPEYEINNEPILEGDFRTTLNNDTILARYYSAGIHRLLFQGSSSPFIPTVMSMRLYGYDTNTNQVYNGQSVPVTFYDYFNQAENDVLKGYSFEYDHPISQNDVLTFTWDSTHSTTTSYSIGATGPSAGDPNFSTSSLGSSQSITLPTGSAQTFSTAMLRGYFHPNSKLGITFTNYFNFYSSTIPTQCLAILNVPTGFSGHCNFDGTGTYVSKSTGLSQSAPGFAFQTQTSTHYDPRLALQYRPSADLALRLAIGSAIAPPFLAELTTVPGAITFSSQSGIATEQLQSAGIKPETAFGYDLGADYRFNDGVTFASGDVYLTDLFNHFITNLSNSGTTCPAIDPNTGVSTPSGCVGNPLFFKQNINVASSRFEGIELALRRVPASGIGYTLQGALQRGYAYNLPQCFYGSSKNATTGAITCNFTTNLAVIDGQNFTGGGINGSFLLPGSASTSAFTAGVGGFSNQNLPYAQGYGEVNYRTTNGWYGNVNWTYYGHNNSLNQPAFGILGATVRAPLGNGVSLQISGDNLTNQFANVWPVFGGGVPIPLAGGPYTIKSNGQTITVPAQAATQANVLPPSTIRFIFTKAFGAGATPTTP